MTWTLAQTFPRSTPIPQPLEDLRQSDQDTTEIEIFNVLDPRTSISTKTSCHALLLPLIPHREVDLQSRSRHHQAPAGISGTPPLGKGSRRDVSHCGERPLPSRDRVSRFDGRRLFSWLCVADGVRSLLRFRRIDRSRRQTLTAVTFVHDEPDDLRIRQRTRRIDTSPILRRMPEEVVLSSVIRSIARIVIPVIHDGLMGRLSHARFHSTDAIDG